MERILKLCNMFLLLANTPHYFVLIHTLMIQSENTQKEVLSVSMSHNLDIFFLVG